MVVTVPGFGFFELYTSMGSTDTFTSLAVSCCVQHKEGKILRYLLCIFTSNIDLRSLDELSVLFLSCVLPLVEKTGIYYNNKYLTYQTNAINFRT